MHRVRKRTSRTLVPRRNGVPGVSSVVEPDAHAEDIGLWPASRGRVVRHGANIVEGVAEVRVQVPIESHGEIGQLTPWDDLVVQVQMRDADGDLPKSGTIPSSIGVLSRKLESFCADSRERPYDVAAWSA